MSFALNPSPLFGLGNVGKSPNVCAQTRTNLYLEIQKDGEKNNLTMYPTPGLAAFVNFGASPCRGIYQKDDFLYAVNGADLWRIANDGTSTNVGTLLTTGGKVDITDNGTQMLIVDGTYGYIYTFLTNVLAQITDVDFPPPMTCAFMNGRFLVGVTNSALFYISALYDGFTWNGLDFATAESDPDNLIRIFVNEGQIVLLGDKTTEFWGDSGGVDFPFARVGASAIEWGLGAIWSLAKFQDSLIFLRKNRLGASQVCTLTGYTCTVVSNPEIDYIISQYGDVSNAVGFSYMISGHPFYQINFPSADASWLYDGLTGAWSKVQSGTGRHRGELQRNFLNRSYVTDYENGLIYRFDQNVYTDNGETIIREWTSRHQMSADWSGFDELWIEMEGGVGLATGQGSNPQLMMQVCKDGGHEYGSEVWVPFGKIGEYRRRAAYRRLGRARDWLFRFRVTDPVYVVFVAAWGRYGKG